MFPLGGKRSVLRYSRPSIAEQFTFWTTDIDHWFNGKDHIRLEQYARIGLAIMENLRLFVELNTNSVTSEISDHRIAQAFCMSLNCVANVSSSFTRLHLLDANLQALLGNIY